MSPTMTPDQVQKAVELRASGASYAAIGAQFGVSESGVRYRLYRLMPPTKRYHRVTRDEAAEIRDLRASGVGVEIIAAQFGISIGTVTAHSGAPKPERLRPPTKDELVLSAFPWSVRLPVESREQFAEELAHQPKGAKERDVDRFIRRWRFEAEMASA